MRAAWPCVEEAELGLRGAYGHGKEEIRGCPLFIGLLCAQYCVSYFHIFYVPEIFKRIYKIVTIPFLMDEVKWIQILNKRGESQEGKINAQCQHAGS